MSARRPGNPLGLIDRLMTKSMPNNHINLIARGLKILADIVNKFTYNPGLLFSDEIIIPADSGSHYWLTEIIRGDRYFSRRLGF